MLICGYLLLKDAIFPVGTEWILWYEAYIVFTFNVIVLETLCLWVYIYMVAWENCNRAFEKVFLLGSTCCCLYIEFYLYNNDKVIEFLNWPNASSCTVALGLALCTKAYNLTTIYEPNFLESTGAAMSHNLMGLYGLL
jgi:hypothetical protein